MSVVALLLSQICTGLILLALVDVLPDRSLLAVLICLDDYLNVFLARVVVVSVAVQHVVAHRLPYIVPLLLLGRAAPAQIILALHALVLRVPVILIVIDDVLPLRSLALGWFGLPFFLFFTCLGSLIRLFVAPFSLLRLKSLGVLDDFLSLLYAAHAFVSLFLLLLLLLVFDLGHPLDLLKVLEIGRLAADYGDRHVVVSVDLRNTGHGLRTHHLAAELRGLLTEPLLSCTIHGIFIAKFVHEARIKLVKEVATLLVRRGCALLTEGYLIVLALVLL